MNTLKKNTLQVCFCVQLSISHIQHAIDSSDGIPNYKSFFSSIQATEKLPLTIYANGRFLEWQKGKRQAYAMLINELLARKQIELLSGGYYDPYFSLLPASDIVGQIELMTAAIRTRFGKRPRGLFLTSSAWLPSLITPFTKCGMEYCLLDYRLFPAYGKVMPAFAPLTLEDNGKTITAFPYIPASESYAACTPKQLYEKLSAAALYAEQGVCLFFLPVNTYVAYLEKNKEGESWFSTFMRLCSQADSPITLAHTAHLIKNKPLLKKPAYIAPNTILNGKLLDRCIKHELMRQPRSFQFYTKMMYVHMLANGVKGDKARKKYALQEFWKAQNAELFTLEAVCQQHRAKLRRIGYHSLLLAEKQTRIQGIFADGLIHYDVDLDGYKEVLSQRSKMNMYVHSYGGKIFECDVFSAYKNYADVPLDYAGMFIDYVVSEQMLVLLKKGETSHLPDIFSKNTYQEIECNNIRSELKLITSGFFNDVQQPVSLKKQYSFFNEGVQVQYIVKNESPHEIPAYFMVEVDIALENAGIKFPTLSVFEANQKKECSIVHSTFDQIPWVQLDDPDGKIQFTMEANEVPNLIVIPVYEVLHVLGTSTNTQELKGVRLFFYWKAWNTGLIPTFETEKLLSLKIKSKK
ncbi:MAG: alpha-amylase/4-alpha-glucanotransferase domain-containing protein [Treponema sp.]